MYLVRGTGRDDLQNAVRLLTCSTMAMLRIAGRTSALRCAGSCASTTYASHIVRHVSTCGIDEMQSFMRDEVCVIDVRSPQEVTATGALGEGVLNIPLEEILQGSLSLDEDEFLQEYGAPRPAQSDKIVFTCAAGVRSEFAARAAEAAGFTQTINYLGGANEWFSK